MKNKDFAEIIIVKIDGRLKHRESKNLEFKANYNFNSFNTYSKTFCAFANNSGGMVIFGIKDKPREPIGMTNDNFANIEVEKISEYLNNHFAPEINFSIHDFKDGNKKFGVFVIEQSRNKPVMCIRETKGQVANEGDIYYRYAGRSEKIKYPELKLILEENREFEKKKWMEHIQSIAKIGPQNIALIDVYRGHIESPADKKIIIDKQLLKDIKIIQEGRFVEKDGAPALKLIGTIEGIDPVVADINLHDDFYTTKELGEKLGLLSEKKSTAYITALVWKFKIQDNSQYYQHKNNQKLYSKICYEFLSSKNITIEHAKETYKEYLGRNQ